MMGTCENAQVCLRTALQYLSGDPVLPVLAGTGLLVWLIFRLR
ncbi:MULTISPECIES: hypothetical protein [Enterobacter]|nr:MULTISPECIES: hypothetical protein [Enterobacter]